MKKQKKRKFNLAKCCKGTIALFLAVLMTPFLTIAMLLVEVGRYNSAVSMLDEAMGVSATSLLAGYDEYMKERWGLLALDQESDLTTQYNRYLTTNAGVMGSSLKLNNSTATGMYPLSNNTVLQSQLREFNTLYAPTTLLTNFSNLSDLIGKLEDLANVGKYFDLIGNGVGVVDSSITLVESADSLKKLANDLDSLKTTYKKDYTAFETAVSNLANALSEPRPTGEENEDEAKKYDKKIEKLKKSVDSARNTYSKTLSSISSKLQEYKDLMVKCNEAIEKIKSERNSAANTALQLANDREKKQEDLKAVDKSLDEMKKQGKDATDTNYANKLKEKEKLEGELAETAVSEGLASATKTGLSTMSSGWQDAFSNYSDKTMGEKVKAFSDLSSKVSKFKSSSVTKDTVIEKSTYYHLTISGYVKASDIEAYLTEQAEELNSGSLSALVDGIISFFNSLLKLQLFYDPALSADINVKFYEDTLNGLPGGPAAEDGALAIISDIGDMFEAAQNFAKNIVKLKLLKALKELKNFIESVIELGKDIVDFAWDIVQNIGRLFTSTDQLYLTTYAAFNLPCRTDFTSGTPGFTGMTGYSLDYKSLPKKTSSTNLSRVDDIVALVNTIRNAINKTGKDYTFCGAELEYVLFGCNSELGNQAYAFVSIYLLRLLLNIGPILTNPEVQSIAASSTFGYPVVMILEILAEPLVDTILLVNGSDIDFWKTKIFLTPSGCVDAITKICSLAKGMSQSDKDKMGDGLLEAFDTSKSNPKYKDKMKEFGDIKTKSPPGIFSFNYREYCFLILLITVEPDAKTARLANLMQMETLNYYKNQGKSYTFDLTQAFTFVQLDANASVAQMLPSLTDSSIFTVDRKQYRGY